MATLGDLLRAKGTQVHTIEPSATALDAVLMMNEHRIGALVVTQGGRMVGMFTERDVLRRVVGDSRTPAQIRVQEVMTRDVLHGSPQMAVEDVAYIMKERRVRHVPVCDPEGRLLGLISIGDVNAHHLTRQEATIQHLEDYVYGRV